ncbi:MAG TPA: alpha/beta fold hydrolase [Actinomycetota bacterium]|nr:alpha/beta fold hydrolase [Actinomycetota bacterium]
MTALLLVHAFPLDASMWDGEIEALGAEAEVLAPSLPGFGGTSSAGDVLSMEAMADFLSGQLDEAGVDRAVVCGLSMGGYAAFELFRRHRGRVAGLVLADTRAEADDEAGRQKRQALAEKVRAEGSGVLADAPPPLLSEGADPALWDHVKEIIRRQPGEAIAAASLGMASRPDSTATLSTIDVPTTVIVGSADTLTPPPMSDTLAQGIAGAELVTLEDAGHLSNLEAPDGFREAVLDLLAKV